MRKYLFLILYMHTDTETQQFGDQAHTAVCINVSLFISYRCASMSVHKKFMTKKTNLWQLKQVSILVNASDSMFLFIDFVRVTNCFLTIYLPKARGQQGNLAYLVFTQLRCYCCFSSRTGSLTLLNAAKTKHLYGKV